MYGEKRRGGKMTWLRHHKKQVFSLQEKSVGTTISAETVHKKALNCLHGSLILRGQCACLGP